MTEVLFEETVGQFDVGHTPDYLKVYVPAAGRHNVVLPVHIADLYADGLRGEVEN